MTPTLADVDWPVRTERLLIRRCAPADAEANYRLRLLPEVAAWANSVPTDLDGWRARFRDPRIAPHLLTVEREGQVIGELVLHLQDGWSQHEVAESARAVEAEVGWMIDPAHQGRGLATEAARALLEVCFGTLGLRRVVATTLAVNRPSWRVMEKLGMRLESENREVTLHRDHGWVDGRGYALLAEEWA